MLTQIAVPGLRKLNDASLYLIWIESIFKVLFDKSISPKGVLELLTKICSFERDNYYFPGITQQEDNLRDLFLWNGVLGLYLTYLDSSVVKEVISNCEIEDF